MQRSATQLGRTETIELEHGRLLPPTLQVHVARIPLLSSGAETTPRSSDFDVDCQARLLGGAKVEVVALAQTAASLSADDYDERITKRMSEAGGVPAIISARAISLAVRSLGAFVAPFPIPVLERLEHHYIGKYGLECCKRKLFRYRFVRSYTRHSGMVWRAMPSNTPIGRRETSFRLSAGMRCMIVVATSPARAPASPSKFGSGMNPL